MTTLNRLRREHRALQLYDNLRFQPVTAERTLFYRKALPADDAAPAAADSAWTNAVFVAVNCDPLVADRAVLHPVLPEIGIGWNEPYALTDLMSGDRRTERGADLAVDLPPGDDAFRIFTIAPLR